MRDYEVRNVVAISIKDGMANQCPNIVLNSLL